MGFWNRLFGRTEERAAPATHDIVAFYGGGGYNDSGVNVNELTALSASAVFACCKILAEAFAQLPVHIFQKQKGEKLYDHAIARLLAAEPNDQMTAASFREAMMLNLCLFGNAYAFVDRDAAGVPIGLYPLLSNCTRAVRRHGVLTYETRLGSHLATLTPDQVFHVLSFSFDGITGISPIQQARQTIGLSLALDRFAAKLFSNGGNIGGILKTPPMKEDALKHFVSSWKANYAGLDNAFRVAVLPDGFDFKATTIDPERGQMRDSRVHQVLEVARLYRVPPHMLGVLDKASYASIEQQSMDFYGGTIQPIVTRWEQEANRKLLLEREKPTHEVRFNLDAMLRASTQERYAAYMTGRQAGFLSVNDIRRKENLPPVEGGDVLLQPLNMAPVGQQRGDSARSLIEDAARRLLIKEQRAMARLLKKHAGKPDDLRAAVSDFYGKHADLVARVMAPPLRAAGLTTDPQDYAARHVAESTRQITAGATADDLEDWPELRAADIADDLLNEGNEDAAA